jgi:hypothetical protein
MSLSAIVPGARECFALGLRSTAHPENAKGRRALRIDPELVAHPELDALFDPQTSGGLRRMMRSLGYSLATSRYRRPACGLASRSACAS